MSDKQHAYTLLDQLGPGQIAAVVHLLEVMVQRDDQNDDELSEADRRAVAASREYFAKGDEGLSFEQIVAEGGFTMEQVRSGSNRD